MKKMIFSLAVILYGLTSQAQKNLFEDLVQYEGELFTKVIMSYNTATKKYDIQASGDTCEITIKKDVHQNPVGLDIVSLVSDDVIHEYDVRHDMMDHYTEPLFVRNDEQFHYTLMMIDGILFLLKDTPEDLSYYYFGMAFAPHSLLKKKGDEAPKKGLKALKNKVQSSIGLYELDPFFDELKTLEGANSKIKTYMAAMKEKQAKNPLSATAKKQFQDLKEAKTNADNAIAEHNQAYWKSDEGQEILNSGKRVTFKNSRAGTIYLWVKFPNESEVRSSYEASLEYGEETTLSCEGKEVYTSTVPSPDNLKLLTTLSNANCNTTITIP